MTHTDSSDGDHPHGVSHLVRAPKSDGGRHDEAHRLYQDCFSKEPVYGNKALTKRLRVTLKRFGSTVTTVEAHDLYFRQQED